MAGGSLPGRDRLGEEATGVFTTDTGQWLRHAVQSVVVVGAGVAGLQTARALLKAGLQVLVLEQADDVGGVWHRNYSGFGIQVPFQFYEFPEFPYPAHLKTEEYPSGETVLEYARCFSRHFQLYPHMLFHSRLVRLRRTAQAPSQGSSWLVQFEDLLSGKVKQVRADFVVMCSGLYYLPNTPYFSGRNKFAGMQIHARNFNDKSLAAGKRVVVVGAGKTALDCASEVASSQVATSVTWLFRQPHWPLPRRLANWIPFKYISFSQLPSSMLPPYYTAGFVKQLWHSALRPFKRLFWCGLESMITRQFGLEGSLVPPLPLELDLFYGGLILDSTWNKLVQQHKIQAVHGEISHFEEDGVVLQQPRSDQDEGGGGGDELRGTGTRAGAKLPADLILYCTGYSKSYDYLDGGMKARLHIQKDGLYLYRSILPPAVPHLAYIGSEVSTFNNILTSALQAEWLAAMLTGSALLPSPAEMQRDVRLQQRWRRAVMPSQRHRGCVVMLYMIDYHAQLLRDLGVDPNRKGCSPLARCLSPYSASDYRHLFEANADLHLGSDQHQAQLRPGRSQGQGQGQGHKQWAPSAAAAAGGDKADQDLDTGLASPSPCPGPGLSGVLGGGVVSGDGGAYYGHGLDDAPPEPSSSGMQRAQAASTSLDLAVGRVDQGFSRSPEASTQPMPVPEPEPGRVEGTPFSLMRASQAPSQPQSRTKPGGNTSDRSPLDWQQVAPLKEPSELATPSAVSAVHPPVASGNSWSDSAKDANERQTLASPSASGSLTADAGR